MITEDQYDNSITKDIPDIFLRDKNYDRYGRRINYVGIKLTDGTFTKKKMANIRNGNIFGILKEDDSIPSVLYRAIDDPFYSIKEDRVYIKCVLYEDYKKDLEILATPYEFKPRESAKKVCRKN